MAAQLDIYNEALRLIGEHSIANPSVDEEPRYVLDDAYARVVLYCLAQGWWRFAFFTLAVTPGAPSPIPGYTQAYAKPANWLRTHSLGILNGTRLVPIDFVEQGGNLLAKYATGVVLKYLKASSTETDPANWPEVFAKLVAAYLAFECCERISQSRANKADIFKIYSERLTTARALESYTPPLTLPEHAVERAARGMLEQGFWRFSVVSGAPAGTSGPAIGYSNAFTLPADYLRVYGVAVESSGKLRPIDWRIEGTKLSAKASPVRIEFVSTNYVDPSTWPEAFIDAVEAALVIEDARAIGAGADKIEPLKAQLDRVVDGALAKDGLPRPLRPPEHAVETSARELLEQGFWRHSIKTVTPAGTSGAASGYSNAFTPPADLLRIFDVTQVASGVILPVDWQATPSVISANASAVRLRYVSSDFLVPSTWPEGFAQAVDSAAMLKALLAGGADLAAKAADARGQLDKIVDRALAKDGLPRPKSLAEHSVRQAAKRLLEQGFWRHSVKTVAPATTTGPATGYSNAYTTPADYLRVYDVVIESSGKLRPIDWRIEGTKLSAKAAAVRLQYVSSDFLDATTWNETFARAVEAYLALQDAESRGATAELEQLRAALDKVTDAALGKDLLPRPHILPEHAVETSARELLEQGFWRHSVKTVAPATTTGPATGYSNAYTTPADYLRVYDVVIESSGKLRPIDWRIEGTKLSAKAAAVRLQYVSSDFLVPSTWPEAFAAAIDVALMVKATAAGPEMAAKAVEARATLDKAIDAALAKDGLPRPLRLPEHAVERSARKLLEDGFWRFSIKSVAPTGTTGPAAGYANAYTLPADWLRSYDVSVLANSRLYQVDRHEEGGKLSTQFAANVKLRYVSSDFLVPSTWPEAFAHATDVMLSIEALRAADPATDLKAPSAQLAKMLEAELGRERLPRPLLLPPGAVDRVVRAQLEQGPWKFAIKTVALTAGVDTPSAGYRYAFDKPTDWQRTVRAYRLVGAGVGAAEYDVDFRDEGNDLHANYAPIQLRYIPSTAVNPAGWTELFATAFDAGLRYESALAEQLPEATVAARYEAWHRLLGQAEVKDGLNERPKVYNSGRFNNARRGGSGYSGLGRDPQWPYSS